MGREQWGVVLVFPHTSKEEMVVVSGLHNPLGKVISSAVLSSHPCRVARIVSLWCQGFHFHCLGVC